MGRGLSDRALVWVLFWVAIAQSILLFLGDLFPAGFIGFSKGLLLALTFLPVAELARRKWSPKDL